MASFKRLPLRESVIRRTTIQALQIGAVNLSQGFPDDDAPAELKELARQAVAGCNHQYTDPSGAPVLRRAIADKMERFNGIAAHPDRNIVVTCGATEGMVVAMEALVERGEEVITFAPMYENYVLQSIVSGLQLRILETREPDFSLPANSSKACTHLRLRRYCFAIRAIRLAKFSRSTSFRLSPNSPLITIS